MEIQDLIGKLEEKKRLIEEETKRTGNKVEDLIVCVDACVIIQALDLIDSLKGMNEKLLLQNVAYKEHFDKMDIVIKEINARIDKVLSKA